MSGPGNLELEDGTRRRVRRDPLFGWFVVEGVRPKIGASVILDGIAREVVIVARLPGNRHAISVLPDFDDPGCEACRLLDEPPTAEYCRTACQAKGLGDRVGEVG